MEQVIGSSLDSRVSTASAASWPAIFAGAVVAVAVSFILVALGGGLGFAIISPWPGHGASATEFTVNAAIWLIVSQWVSAAVGGYIAGRLRTKWVGTHTHEVFFRDTAHGLVTWSVATLMVVLVLASSATSMIGGGLRAMGGAVSAGAQGAAAGAAGGAAVAGGAPGAMQGAMPGPPGGGPSAALTYDIDKLFRPTSASPGGGAWPGGGASGGAGASPAAPSPSASAGAMGAGAGPPGMDTSGDPRVEAVFIAFNGIAHGGFSDDDRGYLAQIVQRETGVPAQEAQKRVDDFVTATKNAEDRARAAADAARKAAAETAIYTALALLIGAFIACVSAAIGGRLRDEHP